MSHTQTFSRVWLKVTHGDRFASFVCCLKTVIRAHVMPHTWLDRAPFFFCRTALLLHSTLRTGPFLAFRYKDFWLAVLPNKARSQFLCGLGTGVRVALALASILRYLCTYRVEPATLRVWRVRLNQSEDVRTERSHVAQSRISDRRVVSL